MRKDERRLYRLALGLVAGGIFTMSLTGVPSQPSYWRSWWNQWLFESWWIERRKFFKWFWQFLFSLERDPIEQHSVFWVWFNRSGSRFWM